MDIGYLGAFLGGILTLLSPCSAMLLPAFFAYAFTTKGALSRRTGLFYLGLITTLVPLGVFAASLGGLLIEHRGTLVAIAAGLVIVLGVMQLIGVRISLPARVSTGSNGTTAFSTYLLGAVYGIAGVCAGPILGSVLSIAALGGNALYGGTLLAIYALGMAVPVFLLAILWDRFRIGERGLLRPRAVRIGSWHTTLTELVSGVILVGLGVLLLLSEGTSLLSSVLTVRDQYEVELWARRTGDGVSDLVVMLAVIAALILIWLVSLWRRKLQARKLQRESLRQESLRQESLRQESLRQTNLADMPEKIGEPG